MNKLTTAALAALALAAIIPIPVTADEPANPVQGAVCSLYQLLDEDGDPDGIDDEKKFADLAAAIEKMPAVATFVDAASEFKCFEKKTGIDSNCGMWKGWIKQEKAGTYTFTCQGCRGEEYRYSIWINGSKAVNAVYGQRAFNVELNAGFNSIKIVIESADEPFSITYKKAGSVKDPVSFGPESMFYDDDDE